jgi:hypothetical protein
MEVRFKKKRKKKESEKRERRRENNRTTVTIRFVYFDINDDEDFYIWRVKLLHHPNCLLKIENDIVKRQWDFYVLYKNIIGVNNIKLQEKFSL